MSPDTSYTNIATLQSLRHKQPDNREATESVVVTTSLNSRRRIAILGKPPEKEKFKLFSGTGYKLGYKYPENSITPADKPVTKRSVTKILTDSFINLSSAARKAANFLGRAVLLATNPKTYLFGAYIFNRRIECFSSQLWNNHCDGNIMKRAVVAATVVTLVAAIKTSDYVIDELIKCFTDPMAVAGNLDLLGYDVSFLNGYYDYGLHDTAGRYFFGANGVGDEVDPDAYITGCAKAQAKSAAIHKIVNQS